MCPARSTARVTGASFSRDRCGDAVGDRLAVAVDQRHIDGKIDAGARHHLPLEGIAMQVDDARQHQQVAGVDRRALRHARCATTSRILPPAIRSDGVDEFRRRAEPGRLRSKCRSRCSTLLSQAANGGGSRFVFARKSSTVKLAGNRAGPCAAASWSQSHQASWASRLGDLFRKSPSDRPRRIAARRWCRPGRPW